MADLEKLSLAELNAERDATMQEMNDLDEAISHIKTQIAKAKSRAAETGEYADTGWFRRAEGAKRIKGRERVALQNDLAEINREIKKREHAARQGTVEAWGFAFMRVVQRDVTPEKFEEYRRAADIECAVRAQPVARAREE